MKRQLSDVKQKNRQLQSQIDDYVLNQKLPDNVTDNTIINNHIKSLNETICKYFLSYTYRNKIDNLIWIYLSYIEKRENRPDSLLQKATNERYSFREK